jgi:prolyl oligopeptidase
MKNSTLLILFVSFLTLQTAALYSQEQAEEDPYLWLEEVESEKSLDWVKEQNKNSEQILTSNPLYENLQKRYLEVYNDKDKIAYPNIVGDYVYNLWQDEKYERGLWRRMLTKDYLKNNSNWETLIDLDALSEKEGKKWVYAGATFLEPANDICIVALSDGGTDQDELREFNVKSKKFVANGITFPSSKGGVSWINKNKVLVARDFGEGSMTTSGYPSQIKLMDRNGSMDEAKLIFKTDTTNLGAFPASFYDNNKQYIFIYEAISFYESNLFFLVDNQLKQITYPKDAEFAGFYSGSLIVSLQSDWNINDTVYKKGTLLSMNLQDNLNGKVKVKTIYQPNDRSSFVSVSTSKDFIVVNSMENVQNKLYKYTLNNDEWSAEKINAPEFGSIYLTSSNNQTNDYFFRFSNFITPTTLYHSTGTEIKPVKKLKNFFKTDNLEVKQFNATSKDGTKIPYFLVHQKDLQYNGKNPTMIYAYGGFNASSQPNYSSTIGIGWLEQGGVYVLANIRGGGEFGPSWHQAAMKEKRQNAYDDFYAVSEELIAKKITSAEHLGAFGWSNGGLMAGVVFTQRPDLYKAVVVGAPLLDMKRYSKLLAGASWMGEYGNPDIPEEWAYIKKYSPYHNVSKDKEYPEVYFVTSTKDDRVHPGHARKMAAKMKDMGHPYIYHETIEGGHGAASTNAQQAEMWSSIYTYFNMKLNNKPLDKK